MHKLKRYGLKKWNLMQSRQLRRLWFGLFLIFLLCVTFQVVQKLQCTSKCQLKQLSLQQSRAHENSLQDDRDPNSAHLFSKPMEKSITSQNVVEQLMPKPSLAEKKRHIMKLSKAFNQTKLLDSSLGSEEEFWQKPFVKGAHQAQMLHFEKRPEGLNHRFKQIPAKDALTFSASRKFVAVTKAGTFLIKMNNFTTKMNADDQAPGVNGSFQSPTETSSSNHRRSKSSRVTKTNSQNFSVPKDKKQSEEASSEMDNGVSLPEKTVLPTVGRMVGENMTNFSQGTTCKPRTHIVFLKVHKSASSTVMNILFRFGETHNLTFALPLNGGHQLNYPYYFTAAAVEPLSPSNGSQFNIMCHHMRFFKPEIAKVMLNSTFYFSILRNPVQLMESSFTYYKGTSVFSKAKNLEEFLNQPSQFYNASATDSHYAKNLMTFDFGYNHNGNFSAKHIQLMLQAIEAEFDLLLISEYFDESMVLLKETLCWDLDDVTFFPLNSRHNSAKNPLSERVAEKIKSWNKLDWAIYAHFNKTFWKKIDRNIGRERMQNEVRILQQKREQLAKICLQGSGSVVPQLIRDRSLAPLQYGRAVIMGYNLKPRLDKTTRQKCQRMVTPELQYNRLLYRKQFPKKALKPSNIAILPKLSDRRAV
ncbi:galactose-3-O-sulfotransferase 2-like isoform X2 [Eublepharis macularius]|uniref:Galactose-3-O-sulfotransferase 2-like isoform X2 n=1 Tax=Eublepharis macularius TaxID=481883 RepID=A0AA97JN19_EUBMA|nr:galactose-3-O-sulfotransferase 2-like isoform X2 [Eublepharis macularius]